MTRRRRSSACPRLVARQHRAARPPFLGWEQEAAALAPVIAEEAGGRPTTSSPPSSPARWPWTHRLVFRAAFTRLLDGEDRHAVAAELRAQAARAYDLLEDGLAGYGA